MPAHDRPPIVGRAAAETAVYGWQQNPGAAAAGAPLSVLESSKAACAAYFSGLRAFTPTSNVR
jgi:hypothetical protein